jgi:predicted protein tyrosine phosphatase
MSFLYRHGVLISRKQPYLDWANSLANDEQPLSDELSRANRTLYLVREVDGEPDLTGILEEFWAHIFEHELSAWVLAEDKWPDPRTREMFDTWFDVELNDAVFDLTPEEPLTQADVDAADLREMMERCASCGLEIEEHEGRMVGFKLNSRDLYAPFEGRVLPLALGDGADADVALALVTTVESEAAQAGNDVVVRVCSSNCERAMRSAIPKALRRFTRRIGSFGHTQDT